MLRAASAHDDALDRVQAATADLDPPFAAVDLPTLRRNADDLIRRANGVPVRVASKSVRCRAVLSEVLGPELTARGGFRGIMTYSLREALWLVERGARDILMGYPTVDRTALGHLAASSEAAQAITLMIDSVEHLRIIRGAAREAPGKNDFRPRVCLDIDASLRVGPVHLGVRRSPIRTPEAAAELARRAEAAGFDVVGVMFYEAQIAGLPDSSLPVRLVKGLSARELASRRRAVVDAVRAVVGELELVNGGGTGSLEVTTADRVVTEATAGSGLYVPTLFDGYRAFTPEPSMFFALPAVRKPAPSITTLFGGGYIASGPPGASRVPRPVRPEGLKLLGTEGAGEVQTPVRGRAAASIPIGGRVWFRHAKAGELCERFDRVYLVDEHGRTEVPTYRGEGGCW
ncbi:D-serine deaminase, pyridoxal phosphate-dependent [Rhodococcus rhodochrous J3]|uniref:D-serine deaminase, pyridoxal phosphate-dependent n=1 Tax=Rhodococcus rhodochrous J3 TaxID=903528 RepID=A0ABY1M942_RHORH|nr:alanine racemase [Rhodococcus rhodochrous]SMG29808.1 D-serine deaminase, pyridoxal phosphate-dependent [Rhodococcus rhodochrous J3]